MGGFIERGGDLYIRYLFSGKGNFLEKDFFFLCVLAMWIIDSLFGSGDNDYDNVMKVFLGKY